MSVVLAFGTAVNPNLIPGDTPSDPPQWDRNDPRDPRSPENDGNDGNDGNDPRPDGRPPLPRDSQTGPNEPEDPFDLKQELIDFVGNAASAFTAVALTAGAFNIAIKRIGYLSVAPNIKAATALADTISASIALGATGAAVYARDYRANLIASDPLVIDLDGNGIDFTSFNVSFDFDSDGFAELGAWVGAGDGILGGVDKVFGPESDGRDEDEAEVAVSGLVVAGGQPSAVFQL